MYVYFMKISCGFSFYFLLWFSFNDKNSFKSIRIACYRITKKKQEKKTEEPTRIIIIKKKPTREENYVKYHVHTFDTLIVRIELFFFSLFLDICRKKDLCVLFFHFCRPDQFLHIFRSKKKICCVSFLYKASHLSFLFFYIFSI